MVTRITKVGRAVALLLWATVQTSVSAQETEAPKGVSVEAFKQLSDEGFKLTMIQPGRRVVQFMQFDAPLTTLRLKEFLRRYEAIASQYQSQGKPRYWKSAFCGFGVNRLYVTVEFPDVLTMAQAWQRMHSGPELDQWEEDARNAGLVLKSQMFLDNIGGPSLSTSSYPTKDAPPHVMQIMDMDTGPDASILLTLEAKMKEITTKQKFNRIQRDYQIDWHGERPRAQITMVEYDSVEAMMRGNLVMDNSPEIKSLLRSGGMGNIRRLSECVTEEVR